MQPIIDLNLLKHHRVDYGARRDDGARRSPRSGRAFSLFLVAVVALGLATALPL